ncbi:MAG: hypothetical protein ACJ798_14965 [Phenylobacterium sp.]
MSDDEIIREAREAFDRCADAEAENRREALDDLRFARLGEQWPAQIKRERDLGAHLLRSQAAPAGSDPAGGRRLRPGAAGMSARLILVSAASAAVIATAAGLYWKGRHDDAVRQRPKVEAALAQAAASGLQAKGAQDSAQRVELVIRQRDAAAATVTELTPKALNAEDAHAPLDPDRARRLLSADEQLCLAAPSLAGCAAGGDAGPGD